MRVITDSTPKSDGFRMPGEFGPHDACWMLWPQRPDVWRFGGKPAQEAFVEVATAINRFETVFMGVRDPARRRQHPLHHPAAACCLLTCREGGPSR